MSDQNLANKPRKFTRSAAALLGTTALTAVYAMPAVAQDDAPVVERNTPSAEAPPPVITITGSRIG